MTSRRALALAMLAALTAAAAPAQSQDFPNRPVRIIVPTAPGGMSDILSRTFAAKVQDRTGKVIVVENRTGANGVLAADYVAKSAPDGYTIYLGFHGTNSVLQHLDAKRRTIRTRTSRRWCSSPPGRPCWWCTRPCPRTRSRS